MNVLHRGHGHGFDEAQEEKSLLKDSGVLRLNGEVTIRVQYRKRLLVNLIPVSGSISFLFQLSIPAGI